MSDISKIDETYIVYEKRYELTKLARESGIDIDYFNMLKSRDKFLNLSYRLRDTNRVHLASFFFGKLFEISGDLEALLNKVDCLIELGEFEEAFRFNCLGYELYLEDPDIDSKAVEKRISYQKALIAFSTEKYHVAEWVCEENIIKYDEKGSYFLLCAVFVALSDYKSAKKFYEKYAHKFTDKLDFTIEVLIRLLNINALEKGLEFVSITNDMNSEQKNAFINYINKYYISNKNKTVLRQFFEKEEAVKI